MREPKFLFSGLVAGAVVGGAVLFAMFAMLAFAIPGPGGWAAWRVGLFVTPIGWLVGAVGYLIWLDDRREQWKKGNR